MFIQKDYCLLTEGTLKWVPGMEGNVKEETFTHLVYDLYMKKVTKL
jgi:hypothetical protein